MSTPTITQIPGSMISAGTINSTQIKSGGSSTIEIEHKEYENECMMWDDYNTWGSTVKNCVIYGVPSWSSMYAMCGKLDKHGNIFVSE